MIQFRLVLEAGTQVLLTLCACLIGPGIFAVTRGPITIQTFLLAPDCRANNTTNCCPGCLGMSPEEYALSQAVPPWVAFPVIFFSGAIIDFFGLPIATVLVSLFSLVGAVLHAIAPYIIAWHTAMLALFTVGTLSCVVALFWFQSISQFLAIRYFDLKWQPLVMSVIFSSSTIGAILAGFLSPRLAVDFGIDISLWSMVWENALALPAATGICLIFAYKTDMLNFEEYRRSNQTQEVVLRSKVFICKSIRAFELDYWLITVVVSLTSACIMSYMINAPLILTSLFDISDIEVADYLAYGWIVQIVVLPSLGLLGSRFKSHLLVIAFGLAVEVVIYLLVFIPPGRPRFSALLLPLPYSILHMTLSSQIRPFVPELALGLASSVYNAFTAFFCSIVTLIVGAVLGDTDPRRAARNALYVLFALVCAKAALLIALALRLKLSARRKKRNDYEQLTDTCD